MSITSNTQGKEILSLFLVYLLHLPLLFLFAFLRNFFPPPPLSLFTLFILALRIVWTLSLNYLSLWILFGMTNLTFLNRTIMYLSLVYVLGHVIKSLGALPILGGHVVHTWVKSWNKLIHSVNLLCFYYKLFSISYQRYPFILQPTVNDPYFLSK